MNSEAVCRQLYDISRSMLYSPDFWLLHVYRTTRMVMTRQGSVSVLLLLTACTTSPLAAIYFAFLCTTAANKEYNTIYHRLLRDNSFFPLNIITYMLECNMPISKQFSTTFWKISASKLLLIH